MNKDIDAQFLCKDCTRYNLCKYYDKRKEESYICKYFHLSIDDFIKFAKEQYGVELIAKKSNDPDTFEKIFG